jgi:hypothetical protein
MQMEISAVRQGISFTGAMLILVAYAGHQMRKMDSNKPAYNLLNAAGSALLGYVALKPFSLGFVILEFAWVGISVWAMWRNARSHDAKAKRPSLSLDTSKPWNQIQTRPGKR